MVLLWIRKLGFESLSGSSAPHAGFHDVEPAGSGFQSDTSPINRAEFGGSACMRQARSADTSSRRDRAHSGSRVTLMLLLLALAVAVALLGGPEPASSHPTDIDRGARAGYPSVQPAHAPRSSQYHRGIASAYGPGLYGNRTACGQTLRRSTIGVAHRTLPCGAHVRICHASRCAVLRVIDRGPFHASRTFDLTEAATRRHWHASARQWGVRSIRYRRQGR